jgi:hypothetical protein
MANVRKRFTAVVEGAGRGGRGVVVPFDAKRVFGEARAPVRGTVNGTPFRSRLAVYSDTTYLGLTKKVRTAAGIDVGATVTVVLERDDEPREVAVPAALADELRRDRAAKRAFDKLSYTHRREYATWIAEAKRADTRERRVAKALEMLRAGATRS